MNKKALLSIPDPDPRKIAHRYAVSVRSVADRGDGLWDVEADRGLLALRIYNADGHHDRDRRIAILDFLARYAYPAPRVVRTVHGHAVSTWGEWTGTLTTTLDDALTPDEGHEAFYNLGVAVGRLHALDIEGADIPEADFTVSAERNIFRRQDADSRIQAWEGYDGIRHALAEAYDRLPGMDNLPRALIHSRIALWHIADTEGGPVLTGWDDAALGPGILDLGFFFSAFALQPDDNALRRRIAGPFLAGYQSRRSLTPFEIKHLPDAIVFGPLMNVIDTWHNQIDEEAWWRARHILDRRTRYRRFAADPAVHAWESFATIRHKLDALWERLPDFADLPRVLIHSDLLVHNLIRRPEGDLVLIDWDGSGLGPSTTDIAYFLRQYAIPPGPEGLRMRTARAFFDGYTAVRTLSRAEWDALPDAFIFCTIFAALWYERVNEPAWWRARYVAEHREVIAERLAEIAEGI